MTRRSLTAWGIAYLLVMAVVVGGLYRARSRWQGAYGTEQAQQDWQAWRQEVAAPRRSAGVVRRVPQSDRPPALVLLTDYFPACLGLSLVLSSALFCTVAFLVRGVLQGAGRPLSPRPESHER
jgi:hypothetical protein